MNTRHAHGLRVVVLWSDTVLREHVFGVMDDPAVTVGEGADNRFVIPAPGIPERFEMFERTSSGYVLRFSDALDGHVTIGGDEVTLEGLGAESLEAVDASSGETVQIFEKELGDSDWGIVDLGSARIYFQVLGAMPVAPMRRLATGLSMALAGFMVLSAVLHSGFLLTAFLSYSPDPELAQLMIDDRFLDFVVPDIVEDEDEEEEDAVEIEEAAAQGIEGEEGKLSKEDSEFEEVKLTDVVADPADKDLDVRDLGVNKALSSELLGSGPLKDIFKNSDGFDSKMSIAMTGGDGEIQLARGSGGFGIRGKGDGGGAGGSWGTVGALGKVGSTGNKRLGAKIEKKGPKKVQERRVLGKPTVGDFCDKKNIRRVVQAKTNAIRYCFEKELQSNPQLSGKILAQWNVKLDGSAANPSIASSSMGNKNVEGCITRVIKRMRFQRPQGGICVIQYPFVFSGLE